MYYAGTLSKTQAKVGQRNAELKDRFVDDTEWFVHEFIDKANCIILQQISIVFAANGGHGHWEQFV